MILFRKLASSVAMRSWSIFLIKTHNLQALFSIQWLLELNFEIKLLWLILNVWMKIFFFKIINLLVFEIVFL